MTNDNIPSNGKVHLTEKGYGSSLKGKVSIVCGAEGEAIALRLLTLPDGKTGGVATMLPSESWDKNRVKSFMPKSAWLLAMNRNQNIGTISLKLYEGVELVKDFETAFSFNGKDLSFLESDGMNGSQEAVSLLNGILWNAISRAFQRSFDPEPNHLFYGKVAMDSPMMTMQFHRDKVKAK